MRGLDSGKFSEDGGGDDEGEPWPDEPADSDMTLRLDMRMSGDERGGALQGTIEAELRDVTNLRDHLLAQLSMDMADPMDRLIGFHLIGALDDAGYVATDLQTIAEQLDCDTARIEATLMRLQAFDPPGVFARDLRECLALQLKDRDRHDPAMACLLENLDLLARGEQAKLMKLCNVDSEDLLDMVAEIRSLNPKPGESFAENAAPPVTPDVIVRRAADGGWLVELIPAACRACWSTTPMRPRIEHQGPRGRAVISAIASMRRTGWCGRCNSAPRPS